MCTGAPSFSLRRRIVRVWAAAPLAVLSLVVQEVEAVALTRPPRPEVVKGAAAVRR